MTRAEQRQAVMRDAAARLRLHATRVAGLTGADPATGERWDPGQVLSHVGEMLPYWRGEVEALIAEGRREPFGRTKKTPSRIARIEQSRHQPPAEVLDRIDAEVLAWDPVLSTLDQPALAGLVGVHPVLGEMDVERILHEFVVGHLVEHADQLEQVSED